MAGISKVTIIDSLEKIRASMGYTIIIPQAPRKFSTNKDTKTTENSKAK